MRDDRSAALVSTVTLFESRSSYQGRSCSILLIFGASEQKTPGQDVESLSASPRAVVHLRFPQLELIKWRTAQKPDRGMNTAIRF